MVAVAGDGIRQFVIGVVTQVSKRWEVGWHETTTITTADERFKSLKIGGTCKSPPGAGGIMSTWRCDRPANCLQRDVVHAVSTQDSGFPWSIFILFAPVERGRNTLQKS